MRKYITLLIIPSAITAYCIHYYFAHGTPFDIWIAQKMNYNERGKHAEMVQAYEPLVEKYPDRATLKYSLAWAYYKTGQYDAAREMVDQYVAEAYSIPRWKDRYIEKIQNAVSSKQ